MITKCFTCRPHAFQDATYGSMVRVFNRGGTSDSPKYRCTVCGAENSNRIETVKKKKKK